MKFIDTLTFRTLRMLVLAAMLWTAIATPYAEARQRSNRLRRQSAFMQTASAGVIASRFQEAYSKSGIALATPLPALQEAKYAQPAFFSYWFETVLGWFGVSRAWVRKHFYAFVMIEDIFLAAFLFTMQWVAVQYLNSNQAALAGLMIASVIAPIILVLLSHRKKITDMRSDPVKIVFEDAQRFVIVTWVYLAILTGVTMLWVYSDILTLGKISALFGVIGISILIHTAYDKKTLTKTGNTTIENLLTPHGASGGNTTSHSPGNLRTPDLTGMRLPWDNFEHELELDEMDEFQ